MVYNSTCTIVPEVALGGRKQDHAVIIEDVLKYPLNEIQQSYRKFQCKRKNETSGNILARINNKINNNKK